MPTSFFKAMNPFSRAVLICAIAFTLAANAIASEKGCIEVDANNGNLFRSIASAVRSSGYQVTKTGQKASCEPDVFLSAATMPARREITQYGVPTGRSMVFAHIVGIGINAPLRRWHGTAARLADDIDTAANQVVTASLRDMDEVSIEGMAKRGRDRCIIVDREDVPSQRTVNALKARGLQLKVRGQPGCEETHVFGVQTAEIRFGNGARSYYGSAITSGVGTKRAPFVKIGISPERKDLHATLVETIGEGFE